MLRRISAAVGHRPHALLAAALALLCAGGDASADGDYEYWAKAVFNVPVSTNWRFSFEERLTFGDEARRLDDHQTDYGFTYGGLADWLAVGLGYKQLFKRADDEWLLENRPLLNITVKTNVRDWAVTSRSRFEYRIPQEDPESWRYRNQVTLVPPVTFTSLEIQPYVSDEVFIVLDEMDFNQQRLYGGLYVALHEKVRLELFYLWKLNEQSDGSWRDTNVIGSYVYFQF